MLHNYGNIVNNYQLLNDHKNKNVNINMSMNNNNNNNNGDNNNNKSESPFVPPLVEAVCGAPGCIKTKRDDGSQLLMCGRCFSIKYCSKRSIGTYSGT